MTSDDHFGRRVEFIPLHLAIVAFEMQCLQLHNTKNQERRRSVLAKGKEGQQGPQRRATELYGGRPVSTPQGPTPFLSHYYQINSLPLCVFALKFLSLDGLFIV